MKQSTQTATSYVCVCARVTEGDFQQILADSPAPNYAELKRVHGIGGQCTSCEYEVKGLLEEHLSERFAAQKKLAAAAKAAAALPPPPKKSPFARLLEALRRPLPAPAAVPAPVAPPAPKPAIRETYRTGVFFLRKEGLVSHLAVANLQFPESPANPNGAAVSFHVSLYGEDGSRLAISREITLPNNSSIECTPEDLFPGLTGDVVGALYTDFDEIAQTGSLRPYGVLLNTSGPARARCHYHDKFALFTDPGFFQNSSPFEPGQTCWMAISNCQQKPYETAFHLQFGDTLLSGQLDLAPMASRWVRLADLFPGLDPARADLSPGLFWLENNQHVMVYFFWHTDASGIWMGQHH